jgi:hypothetical protein
MKSKKLEWYETISDEGKVDGFFQITSDVLVGGYCMLTSFTIRNWKYYGDEPESGIYYLWIRNRDEQYLEFKNIEDAKEKAQEILTEIIIDKFFEK